MLNLKGLGGVIIMLVTFFCLVIPTYYPLGLRIQIVWLLHNGLEYFINRNLVPINFYAPRFYLQLKEYKTDPYFFQLSQKSINSLLIYMFCASCELRIVLPVLWIKEKQKNNSTFARLYKARKSTKNWSSNFCLIGETMNLSRIL